MRILCIALVLPLLGGGCVFSPDPDKRNPHLVGTAPLVSAGAVEVVAELPAPPGNLALGPEGRVYFTFHPEAPIQELKLAELLPDGSYRAFPNKAWQSEREGPYFVAPLGVRVDTQGRLWVLDHGDYGDETPSLTAFDLATRDMVHRFEFPEEVAAWGSMVNDFVVDAQRGFVYIAEPGPYTFSPCLIVYDIAKRQARRVLEKEDCVTATDHHLVVRGRFMKAFGLPLQIGIDSIALSPDGEALYFGPLSGRVVYRVPTSSLRDAALGQEQLAALVEMVGPKPESDGAVMDAKGDLYLTAIEHDAIAVLRGDGRLEALVRNEELLTWPDGLSVGPQGRYLYATVSQLHHVIGEDLDELPKHGPFRIVRVRLPGAE
jgi:sugar lactone lactonase YvrE